MGAATSKNTKSDDFYGISAVSSLTGISSHLLRIWERRYNVVEPVRTDSKRRLYSRDNVDRLIRVKQLVDQGHAIGEVAKLSDEKLQERFFEVNGSDLAGSQNGSSPARVVFVGGTSRNEVRSAADRGQNLELIGEFADIDSMDQALKQGSADFLILDESTLFAETVHGLRDILVRHSVSLIIVIYRFAHSDALDELDKSPNSSIIPLKGPIQPDDLIRIAANSKELEKFLSFPPQTPLELEVESGETPPRRFSDRKLSELASRTSVVDCECPQHLANLLSSLSAFEEYSAQCESRNTEDAALHNYLYQTTAEARHTMETALAKVLKHEGIDID